MAENIKIRWLIDNEQTKIAPKTLSTQILNEDGTQFKDTIESSVSAIDAKIDLHNSNSDIHVTPEEKASYATEEYVKNLYTTLNSNTVLAFYCIEDVTIVTNGIPKTYPANSNVEVRLVEGDTFEIIPTSDNSILSLSAFPNALGTFYSWLEGVAQFSNILFDMNDEAMYSKWSQGNQGSYHVQKAQYTNCIFWSDNSYVSDVAKRTNYTLTHTSQLPLCYSSIPDNTFKAFYLALSVNSDPNWGNQAYLDSFAKATWATQVFSYYGARTIGIVGHDDPDFNITLPKDCRGLMFDARNIEGAGTFDAINTTNFGAKSGSWREAFGDCISLRRLYIKNLKVSLNISWSPVDYDSISYIISAAANTNAITISVSPYTYNLLSQSDFDLATSKNITIALLTGNYVEDRRLSAIANKADANHNHDDMYYTESEIDTKIEDIKSYADTAANTVKDDLLNGAGDAYDTLQELGVLIDENVDAIDALREVATNKADKEHNHDDVYETKEDSQMKYDAIVDAKADWNQNDTSAIDYVKNRTHYETVEEVENIIFDDTLEFATDNIGDAGHIFYYNTTNPAITNFEVGKAYNIVIDGQSYNNVIYQLDGGQDYCLIIGEKGQDVYWRIYSNDVLYIDTYDTGLSHSIQISAVDEVVNVKQLDEKFIPDTIARKSDIQDVDGFMTTENPTGTGSLSMNRKPDSVIGTESVALGYNCEASGRAAYAEGGGTIASNSFTHAEGQATTASGVAAHAEGYITQATGGFGSHSEGWYAIASGDASHAEGFNTAASGADSHAEGYNTIASGDISHAEGEGTTASGAAQHVQGKYNIADTTNTYAHIVGNGTDSVPSNAHTLDWSGNAWYQGTIKVGGTSYADGVEVALKSDLANANVDLSNYYTKTEIDNMELITVEDIDAVCGTTIQMARGVVL